MIRPLLSLLVAALLAGCAVDPRDINREPHMTPVGAGLQPNRVPMNTQPAPRVSYSSNNSFWQDSSADLFRDPRALKIGDVVTVKIQMRDKASLENETNRKRDSTNDLGLDYNYAFGTSGTGASGQGTASSALSSATETKGKGDIARSENINLLVAAVVSDVLANGNLVIAGTQEVRVNYEMRVLSVAGIIRPRDISTNNSIAYEKIAEARISYGGRGRLMEVQQPAWGHQILDVISPF